LVCQGYNLVANRGPFVIPILGFTLRQGRLGLVYPVAKVPIWTRPGPRTPQQYRWPHLLRVILFCYQLLQAVIWMHRLGYVHR
jgi:hypothetical protein